MADKYNKDELLLAYIIHALVKGENVHTIKGELFAEGLPDEEAVRLITHALSGVSESLRERKLFQTGDTDAQGTLRWIQPERLLCSDRECPCPGSESLNPGITGFLYISESVVKMRSGCITLLELQAKLTHVPDNSDSRVFIDGGVVNPILVCKEGAMRRGLDLVVAAKDAKEWCESGLAPLRATPHTDHYAMAPTSNKTESRRGRDIAMKSLVSTKGARIERGNLYGAVVNEVNELCGFWFPNKEMAQADSPFRARLRMIVASVGDRATTAHYAAVVEGHFIIIRNDWYEDLGGWLLIFTASPPTARDANEQTPAPKQGSWWKFWK